jgi:hypothetical protein
VINNQVNSVTSDTYTIGGNDAGFADHASGYYPVVKGVTG